jgi:DNA-binding response OmpR family regulator
MKRVALITDDKYFFLKCSLLLEGIAELSDNPADAEIIAETQRDGSRRRLAVSVGGELKIYPLPMPLHTLTEALTSEERGARLTLSSDGKSAILDGKKIKLTESEYALLSLLITAGGDFVCRERILTDCFAGKSGSMINVYIHYLREKLEADGEKIITASREAGYRVEKKFLGGKG